MLATIGQLVEVVTYFIMKEKTINIGWDLTMVSFECPTKEFRFYLEVYVTEGLGEGEYCDQSRKIDPATAHVMRVT